MRITENLSTLFALTLLSPTIYAKPYPKDSPRYSNLTPRNTNSSLELRQECANPCGWESQYCCGAGEACATQAGIATCQSGAEAVETQADGKYDYYTTTYVETDLRTITTTYSILNTPGVGTPTVTGGAVAPTNICDAGQDFCGGSLCCASDQTCAQYGSCESKTNAPPNRPTSNTVETLTSTASATATEAFSNPVTSDGADVTEEPSSSGLSGGAIAGIVIGVLVGLFLLFLLIACLCCKGILDTLLAIFGCGKKRRTEETYIATHHSHHSGSRPPPRRKWFGMGGGPSRPEKPKKEGMGFLGVAGLLGTLAVLLGLKRRHDRKEEKSNYGGSMTSYSYSDSDYTTSASSASSDRRTRTTRHSRR